MMMNGLVPEILIYTIKYWLGKFWENSGKILGKFWENSGKILGNQNKNSQ
jgi:hypothetical protein